MKIIKKGKTKEEIVSEIKTKLISKFKKHREILCKRCDGQFILDASDGKWDIQLYEPHSTSVRLMFACPTCGTKMLSVFRIPYGTVFEDDVKQAVRELNEQYYLN